MPRGRLEKVRGFRQLQCVPAPETFDGSIVEYELRFWYNGQQLSTYYLMEKYICEKINYHVSSDNRTCIRACPDNEFLSATGNACLKTCPNGTYMDTVVNGEGVRQCVSEDSCGYRVAKTITVDG